LGVTGGKAQSVEHFIVCRKDVVFDEFSTTFADKWREAPEK
jgi:hypothetical protein